ncbi:MAG: hypothetical protein ACI8YB_001922, partial [Patiriisocius sp.]
MRAPDGFSVLNACSKAMQCLAIMIIDQLQDEPLCRWKQTSAAWPN